jgi:NAD/NADP transhydrogenase beta subunit
MILKTKQNMKKYFLYSLLVAFTFISSCSKDTTLSETNLAQKMIEDKAWFLDYSQTGTLTETYVGQATYCINFLKNLTTQDSDGLNGKYSVEKVNGQLQIHLQVKTTNGNSIEYIYDIVSVGASNLILSYTESGTIIKLYFTNKR